MKNAEDGSTTAASSGRPTLATCCVPVAHGAFGQLPERRWDSGDREGWEFRQPGPRIPDSLWAVVGGGMEDEVAGWADATRRGAGALYSAVPGEAAPRILTAAVNDAIALLDHVDRFDGRSAAHAARALFEHLVNALDVDSSEVNTAERYFRHRFVTESQVSRRRLHLPLLDRKARRRESERLDRLGKRSAAPLAAALAEYGPSFARGWARGSLKDRADAHDLADGYEGYRILSGVIHGSSGALTGIVKQVRGHDVHRIGLDLDLAATAYTEGLASFYGFADHLVRVTAQTEAEEIWGRTGNLLLRLQDVRETLRRVDLAMWPKDPPPPPMAVLAIYPSGAQRWYLYNAQDESIVVADPPREPLDAAQARAVEQLTEQVKGYDPADWGGRPMTVMMEGVRVSPRPGAQAVPSASVLIPREHPAFRSS